MHSSTRFLSEKLSTAATTDFNGESKRVEAPVEEQNPAVLARNSSFEANYKLRETHEWHTKVVNITRILTDHDIVMSTHFTNEIREDLNSANDYFDIIVKLAANNILNQRNFGKLMGLGDLLGTSAYYVIAFSAKKLLTQSRFDFIYAQMACVMRHRDNEDAYLDSLEQGLLRASKRKNKRKPVVIEDEPDEEESDDENEQFEEKSDSILGHKRQRVSM
jgi:hypothetical protein